MQIKCIALDDEPLAIQLMTRNIERTPELHLVKSFTDAIEAKEYLNTNIIDLVFIDINMPDISGIDLVRVLKQKPMVIFTTAYKQYALEGFDLDAIDYLLKPIKYERFLKAVKKAVDYYNYKNNIKSEKENNLFIRSEYELIKIDVNEIEYIESMEDYLKIHLTTGRPIMTLMTVKSMLEKLDPSKFKRIHRSYIVPLAKVRSLINRKVRLTNVELPVSDSYIEDMNSWAGK